MLKRIILLAALALVGAPATADAADDTLKVSAQCSGKWVSVTHGVDLAKGQAFFSRDGSYWYGPIVLETFVPDIGGGYAHVDYDIDIYVQMRDSSSTADYRVLAAGKVHTPVCGGEDVRPATTTVPPTITAPVVAAERPPTTTVTPALSWLPALPDSLLRAIVEAVRGLP